MPVSYETIHYFWHRLTTTDMPLEEIVARYNRRPGDDLTVAFVKGLMDEVQKEVDRGMSYGRAMYQVAKKSNLEVVSVPKKAPRKAPKKTAKK